MNPDKLFDYLEGRLSPADRSALEEKLMSDPQLRREFEIARQIHRSGGGTQHEVLLEEEMLPKPKASRLGRQILTAAFALVVLNVAAGIAVIGWKQSRPKVPATDPSETAMRRQLAESLGAAGKNALPLPTFVEDAVIPLVAPRAEWDAVAARVEAAAQQAGGTAARGLPEEAGLTVMVDIPSAQRAAFRQQLLPAASPVPVAENVRPNERTIVQVRIAESAR